MDPTQVVNQTRLVHLKECVHQIVTKLIESPDKESNKVVEHDDTFGKGKDDISKFDLQNIDQGQIIDSKNQINKNVNFID